MTPTLKIYKTQPHAVLPTRATEQAACWDISACLTDNEWVKIFNQYNENTSSRVSNQKIELWGGHRMLVPTGLIFEIPEGYSLRIHPRSGLSVKTGINLINCQGVIDSDYYHETFVALVNNTEMSFEIQHGDRIAQCELVPVQQMIVEETATKPEPRTSRTGGFGSTGITS
jgi:dUTP pyrophosphatase